MKNSDQVEKEDSIVPLSVLIKQFIDMNDDKESAALTRRKSAFNKAIIMCVCVSFLTLFTTWFMLNMLELEQYKLLLYGVPIVVLCIAAGTLIPFYISLHNPSKIEKFILKSHKEFDYNLTKKTLIHRPTGKVSNMPDDDLAEVIAVFVDYKKHRPQDFN